MDKEKTLLELLKIKEDKFHKLISNIKNQERYLENNNNEKLLEFQTLWYYLTKEVDEIDEKVNQLFYAMEGSNQYSKEIKKIIENIESKNVELNQLNIILQKKGLEKIRELKNEIETLHTGRKIAEAYKIAGEETPTYIDKKY